MITMREIAKLTHVSQPTVSRVLNGSQTVAPEIRERVLACARAHNYQFNALAKGLQGRKTKLLGLLMADVSSGVFAGLARAVEAEARNSGYSILLFNSGTSPQAEQDYLDVARRYRVDGVLAVPIRETSGSWQAFANTLDVPIVAVLRRAEGLDSVYADRAGSLAAEHLLERGFQRFLFVGPERDEAGEEFRRALDQAGFGPQTASLPCQNGGQLEQTLETWLRQSRERPGIFASSDSRALRVLSALHGLKVSIPEEAGVMGFGDTSAGRCLSPGLSSVSQPVAQLAREAVARLLDRIEHPGPRKPLDRSLSCALAARESTGALP